MQKCSMQINVLLNVQLNPDKSRTRKRWPLLTTRKQPDCTAPFSAKENTAVLYYANRNPAKANQTAECCCCSRTLVRPCFSTGMQNTHTAHYYPLTAHTVLYHSAAIFLQNTSSTRFFFVFFAALLQPVLM